MTHRGESIGKGLKIGHELTRFILATHDFFALFNLFGDTQLSLNTDRPRTSRVAKETARTGPSTITIRTAKASINGNLVDSLTKTFFKMLGIKLIGFHWDNYAIAV